MPATPVTVCRSCGAQDLVPFLDLGSTPLANALLRSPDAPAPTFPLEVGFCQACTLVQLLHVLAAEDVFDADYPYFSSYSESLDVHSRRHVADLLRDRELDAHSFVVEVASNDGYLLRHLVASGVRVLGVEPTPGPATAASAAGVPTVQKFLGPETAAALVAEHGPADVVIANNVMAHVPDLRGFVRGLATLLGEDGVLQVENPGVGALLEHTEFDTVYHEHFCYFSTLAVERLITVEGLHLNDVEVFPALQGGTLRWTCSRAPGRTDRAEQQLAAERAQGLDTPEPFLAFGDRVRTLQSELRALLHRVTADGGRLAAYGAAAKGATLLNTTGLDAALIDFVVDLNPRKQGRWMPGAQIPIVDPSVLLERQPDHVLVLAWNYIDEVRRQQAEYERRGGRFIVPVPSPRVLPGGAS
ncbi:MAG: class I SAM-dependent methyltransferase [Actinomycetota bacterium]|nr:class I SAM-dependent methyltransferase [Actinomycetota bacterium]